MSSDWLRVALLLSEISRSRACSALYGEDKTMLMLFRLCNFEEWWNSQCAREVVISFAGYCSSLIFIFSFIRTLDYPDYFLCSQQVRIIEVRLYIHLVCKCWLTVHVIPKKRYIVLHENWRVKKKNKKLEDRWDDLNIDIIKIPFSYLSYILVSV